MKKIFVSPGQWQSMNRDRSSVQSGLKYRVIEIIEVCVVEMFSWDEQQVFQERKIDCYRRVFNDLGVDEITICNLNLDFRTGEAVAMGKRGLWRKGDIDIVLTFPQLSAETRKELEAIKSIMESIITIHE